MIPKREITIEFKASINNKNKFYSQSLIIKPAIIQKVVEI